MEIYPIFIYAVPPYLKGFGNVCTTVDEHAVHHLQHFWLFQYKLWHPRSVGNVAHASQCKQIALCTQDGFPGCQPLLKTSPICKIIWRKLHQTLLIDWRADFGLCSYAECAISAHSLLSWSYAFAFCLTRHFALCV